MTTDYINTCISETEIILLNFNPVAWERMIINNELALLLYSFYDRIVDNDKQVVKLAKLNLNMIRLYKSYMYRLLEKHTRDNKYNGIPLSVIVDFLY